jgi:hypothetical protein
MSKKNYTPFYEKIGFLTPIFEKNSVFAPQINFSGVVYLDYISSKNKYLIDKY